MHQAVGAQQQHMQQQQFDVLGVPEARPVGQQEDVDQPDEPAPPDGNPSRIQNYVRVAQGAGHNPLPYGSYASLQQAKAPGPESGAWVRFDIPDRIPPPVAWPRNAAGFATANLQQSLGGDESTMYQ